MNSEEIAVFLEDIRKENLASGDVFLIKVKRNIPKIQFALMKDYFGKRHPGVEFIVLDEDVTMERDESGKCPACGTAFIESTKAGDKFRSYMKQCGCVLGATVHQCPPEGSGLMPCCGKTPFELRADRMTEDPAKVTCKGQ